MCFNQLTHEGNPQLITTVVLLYVPFTEQYHKKKKECVELAAEINQLKKEIDKVFLLVVLLALYSRPLQNHNEAKQITLMYTLFCHSIKHSAHLKLKLGYLLLELYVGVRDLRIHETL